MPTNAALVSEERLAWWHDRIFAGLACTLCVSSQVKFAEIQLLELLYAADMLLIAGWLLIHPQPLRLFRPMLQLSLRWMGFAAVCILLSLVALRGDFYLSPDVSQLKQPFVATLSRVGELVLDVFAMVYLACRCREDWTLCRFAMLFYYGVGLAGCVYGCISEIGLLAGVHLGGANMGFRMTGFNNEGGPFGVHLVSVLMVALALVQKRWISRRNFFCGTALLTVSLLASESKSALLEIVAFIGIIAFLNMKPVKALLTVTAVTAIGFFVFQQLGLTQRSLAYFKLADAYRGISLARPTDLNYVAGRLAGAYLSPKMIAAHPLAGIGLGNYTIVRNDPQYRQGSAIVNLGLDSPSLGPVDYIVELGFPAFLLLTWIQVAPAITLLRHRASVGSVAMVLVLPISVWFGAHLNFTYMWISVALGYAVFYLDHDAAGDPVPMAGLMANRVESDGRVTA